MIEHTTLTELDETPHAEVFDRREPRTVRLELAAGETVPEHRHPGSNVVLHLLEGSIELALGDERFDLAPGELVRFDGDQPVSPTAAEDSTAVVVFAPKVET